MFFLEGTATILEGTATNLDLKYSQTEHEPNKMWL